jgi:hypothetical protein
VAAPVKRFRDRMRGARVLPLSLLPCLLGILQKKVSLERVLQLLFERSGARAETNTQVVDWVNTIGGSVPNRRILSEIVDGLCAMDLRDQGKLIRVYVKDMSP